LSGEYLAEHICIFDEGTSTKLNSWIIELTMEGLVLVFSGAQLENGMITENVVVDR